MENMLFAGTIGTGTYTVKGEATVKGIDETITARQR